MHLIYVNFARLRKHTVGAKNAIRSQHMECAG
jgi:hypothetical protein